MLTDSLTSMFRVSIWLCAALLGLASCDRDPTVGTLSENVGSAFAPCSEAEIRFMADKHNFMTAFRPCGNNHFQNYTWSPDGKLLYFQLASTGHVMDAEAPQKNTRPVPVSAPLGPAVWVGLTRLVVPVAPSAEAPDGAANRLAVVELGAQASVHFVDLPDDLTDVSDLQRFDDTTIVLTGRRAGSPRLAWRVDTVDGTTVGAFPWLTDTVDTLTTVPSLERAVVGVGNTVRLVDTTTGTTLGTWTPATRGSLHPNGRWLMLEHLGEPISIFYQRAWDELSDAAREREVRRAKRFEEKLPENYPTEVAPPTLSFVDLPTDRRWVLSSVYGEQFEWYAPTDHYGSFLLWGFEGKQMKRNVLLGDFTFRMRAAEKGRDFMGVSRMGGTPTDDAAQAPPTADAKRPAAPDIAPDPSPAVEDARP